MANQEIAARGTHGSQKVNFFDPVIPNRIISKNEKINILKAFFCLNFYTSNGINWGREVVGVTLPELKKETHGSWKVLEGGNCLFSSLASLSAYRFWADRMWRLGYKLPFEIHVLPSYEFGVVRMASQQYVFVSGDPEAAVLRAFQENGNFLGRDRFARVLKEDRRISGNQCKEPTFRLISQKVADKLRKTSLPWNNSISILVEELKTALIGTRLKVSPQMVNQVRKYSMLCDGDTDWEVIRELALELEILDSAEIQRALDVPSKSNPFVSATASTLAPGVSPEASFQSVIQRQDEIRGINPRLFTILLEGLDEGSLHELALNQGISSDLPRRMLIREIVDQVLSSKRNPDEEITQFPKRVILGLARNRNLILSGGSEKDVARILFAIRYRAIGNPAFAPAKFIKPILGLKSRRAGLFLLEILGYFSEFPRKPLLLLRCDIITRLSGEFGLGGNQNTLASSARNLLGQFEVSTTPDIGDSATHHEVDEVCLLSPTSSVVPLPPNIGSESPARGQYVGEILRLGMVMAQADNIIRGSETEVLGKFLARSRGELSGKEHSDLSRLLSGMERQKIDLQPCLETLSSAPLAIREKAMRIVFEIAVSDDELAGSEEVLLRNWGEKLLPSQSVLDGLISSWKRDSFLMNRIFPASTPLPEKPLNPESSAVSLELDQARLPAGLVKKSPELEDEDSLIDEIIQLLNPSGHRKA